MSERSEMDQWMIKLDPNMKAVFDATYDALETQKKILPGSKDAFDAAEQDLVQQAKDLAQGKPATHKAAQPEAEKSKLGVQGNYERPLEFPLKKYSLKWAEIMLKATCTLSVQNANASETAVTGGVSTGAQQTAVNMGVSVSLGDFDLLDKIDVSGVSVSFKNEFGSSKCKISFGVEGSISLRQVTVTQSDAPLHNSGFPHHTAWLKTRLYRCEIVHHGDTKTRSQNRRARRRRSAQRFVDLGAPLRP